MEVGLCAGEGSRPTLRALRFKKRARPKQVDTIFFQGCSCAFFERKRKGPQAKSSQPPPQPTDGPAHLTPHQAPSKTSLLAPPLLSSKRGRPPATTTVIAMVARHQRRPRSTSTHRASLCAESKSCKRLIEMEQRIDLFLIRKQQDIKDS